MTDKIAEIRALHKYLEEYPNTQVDSVDLHHYLAVLLAEVDRRGAENERLRAALQEFACSCSSLGECESIWDLDGECRYLTARRAQEGRP